MADGGRQRRPALTIAAESAGILALLIAVATFLGLDKKLSSGNVGEWFASVWRPVGHWWSDNIRSQNWVDAIQNFGADRSVWGLVLWALLMFVISAIITGLVSFLTGNDDDLSISLGLIPGALYLFVFWDSLSIPGGIVVALTEFCAVVCGAITEPFFRGLLSDIDQEESSNTQSDIRNKAV